MNPPPWSAHAACRGLDAATFFPQTEEEAEAAKAVCRGCRVVESCLEHALGEREKEGVWGAHTEKERRSIIRRRRRQAS